MIFILKYPENFTLINNKIFQVRHAELGCENCPDCIYYVNGKGKKYKVKECKKHKKASN